MRARAEINVDSFAGGGGASLGITQAGRRVHVAINHDAGAIAMHKANHPKTRHFMEDVWKLSPRRVTGGKPVGLLWASPDCKHHSRAKGGKPVEKHIRSLAWVIVKWAVEVRPTRIILENVREFADWCPIVPRWACAGCGWKGTEGQAVLMRTRRRCPSCDSLRLNETQDLIPDPFRKGLTFRRWVGRLKAQGYRVEWRVLDAADYGAPTHRRRLFLVARCDGEPIVWPDPTHGDPKKIGERSLFGAELKPWRTAAECIDWSIPCPSIFERKRPLAEKTLRRIALGIKRYVLDNPKPFIVGVGGRAGQSPATPVDAPIGTVTAKNDRAIVSPVLARIGQANGNGKYTNDVGEPLTTITSKAEHLLVSPTLVPVTHNGERRANGPEEPLPTITGANRGEIAYIATTLVQTGYGERNGQDPRALDLNAPMGTVVGGGCKQGLAAAFLAKHFGGVVGVPADTPLPTTTTRGTQNQLAVANLIHLNRGDKTATGMDEPLRTATAQGNHAVLVYSFLTKYFRTAIGQDLGAPLHTATGKDRFGLVRVTINGETYVIVDIGMRMLKPRELARGQGFPDSYQLTGTATHQVERIGNSVCPVMAKVLVEANYSGAEALTP